MQLERHALHPHDEYGEIVVLDISRRYTSYDTATETGHPGTVYVRFTADWDDYGPMPSSTHHQEVDDFLTQVGERRGTVTF